ncbi:MAG TPA: DUF1800 domain-containing protein [Pseudonocardia sp.]|nr:DUF1800 domain-containing protein [Pseudonocardia sp.]
MTGSPPTPVGDPPPPRGQVATTPAEGITFPDRDSSYVGGSDRPAPEPPPGREFTGAGAAAAGATVTADTILDTDRPELHLLRRATFGPSPEDVAEIERLGIDGWLSAQLDPDRIDDRVAEDVWRRFRTVSMSPAQIQGAIRRYSWDAMFEYGQATLARQMWSRRQLHEVMVDFWANHLNVTMPSDGCWDVGTSYHNDVIRANALGDFTEMLLAAMRHPAMLRYLDNNQSRKESLNENLGRELLELHTCGVEAGYTEDDVFASAAILSGRTDEDGEFRYDAGRHYTGPVTVLGFSSANGSAEGGLEVGDEYLRYLATHPSTATRIARKLAVRFVSDTPPPSLVERLAAAYLDNGTQIVPVLETLFRSSEFWSQVGQKTRRPLENLVASARTLGVTPGSDPVKGIGTLYWMLRDSGHQPLAWGPPNGYPDVAAAWSSAGGMLRTWNTHRGLVGGWWKELGYTAPQDLVTEPPATVGEYLDRLCERLTLQRFAPEHRAALAEFVGATEDAAVDGSDLVRLLPQVAPLVLDSPYFALR